MCECSVTASPLIIDTSLLFYVLLAVHLSIILAIYQLNAQILVYNQFIIFLYVFWSTL